ncbi:MAG: DEAD/DEAH box helicase [Planctomycetota bacterium]
MVLLETLSGPPEHPSAQSIFTIPPHGTELALTLCLATGRLAYCNSLDAKDGLVGLQRDTGAPFRCATRAVEESEQLAVHGELRRGQEVLTPELLLPEGFAIANRRLLRVEVGDALPLVQSLLHDGPLRAPRAEASRLVAGVLERTAADPSCAPPVAVKSASAPEPVLVVQMARATPKYVPCELQFDYGTGLVEIDDELILPPLEPDDAWTVRDLDADIALLHRIQTEYAAVLDPTPMPGCFTISRKDTLSILTDVVQKGLRVMIDGKPLLSPAGVKVSVATGIDWFEVEGEVCFTDGASTTLAAALLAAKKGSRLIELGDGRTGVLPQELLDKWAAVLELGESADDTIRLPRGQALLLDAMLASRATEVAADAGFRSFRKRLESFSGVAPRREPAAFHGVLRDYQRLGLGWMWFLRELGLGGCLADDMGLGKTVQVLALLQEVHAARDRAPSLLVAPRSLLDNWRNEARRFAPTLRVLDFSGPSRWGDGDRPFEGFDLLLTTYGTLRSDVARYDELGLRFEYAILDEAQAIGNAQSITSKAARLLRADHRLALTGTPVQNHIGELWALFEFLSPGLLGRSTSFQRLVGNVRGRSINLPIDDLRRGLAPFLLRRTKEQVLAELPEKQEQTLYCDLGTVQRRAYDSLRAHYRDALLQPGGALDNKERFLALEALLRLRQAACHEGLIDPRRSDADSAKLEALLPMLEEIAASGHKALVFSQFTQLLGIVRKQLERRGIEHEYLDGRTKKRQPKVDRFQQDPGCTAFLISLKAGGFGLNLTAADYVFLLDPWWNPAAEAQAIDRAHRIGQTQKVTAYRLVARDTVEEKVLQLQQDKRELADALLGDNASLLAGLDRQQLAALLS